MQNSSTRLSVYKALCGPHREQGVLIVRQGGRGQGSVAAQTSLLWACGCHRVLPPLPIPNQNLPAFAPQVLSLLLARPEVGVTTLCLGKTPEEWARTRGHTAIADAIAQEVCARSWGAGVCMDGSIVELRVRARAHHGALTRGPLPWGPLPPQTRVHNVPQAAVRARWTPLRCGWVSAVARVVRWHAMSRVAGRGTVAAGQAATAHLAPCASTSMGVTSASEQDGEPPRRSKRVKSLPETAASP